MRRKTSTAPTRIYTYGCLAPTAGLDRFDDQLRRAHRYRNQLVEIERARRDGIARAQAEHDVLGAVVADVDLLETAIGEARVDLKRARAGGGDTELIAALREMIAALFADRAMARFFLGLAKLRARETEELKRSYDAVNDAAAQAVKVARNSDDAPYWGTYLVVEKAAEQWRKAPHPPRFVRYSGEGRAAVQLQGGVTVAEAESGTDTRLRILPGVPRVNKSGRVQTAVKSTYRTAMLRVGSDGRAPVWCTIPFVMHRPLPADAKITWAWIRRTKMGVRYRYELQLTIEAESFAPPAVRPEGLRRAIAVDIGARDNVSTGELRAALWVDSDGREGEVKQPLTRRTSPTRHPRGVKRFVPNDLGKVRDLRSIRDKNMDEFRSVIVAYKWEARDKIPAELLDRMKSVVYWRSPARFAILLRDWQPHEGDEKVRAALKNYLDHDRHLLDWETRERSRYLNRRKDSYRVFAAKIAREYATVVIAKRDYRRAAEAIEYAPPHRGTENRSIFREAAAGDLRDEIRRAVKSSGGQLIEVPLEGDTAWALDARVCQRLLASAETTSVQAAPLAVKKPKKHVDSPERWGKRRLGKKEVVDPLANEDTST